MTTPTLKAIQRQAPMLAMGATFAGLGVLAGGGGQALGLHAAAGAGRIIERADVERDAFAGKARLGVEALAEIAIDDALADHHAAWGHDHLTQWQRDGAADLDEGVIALEAPAAAKAFIEACGQVRVWSREAKVDLDAVA